MPLLSISSAQAIYRQPPCHAAIDYSLPRFMFCPLIAHHCRRSRLRVTATSFSSSKIAASTPSRLPPDDFFAFCPSFSSLITSFLHFVYSSPPVACLYFQLIDPPSPACNRGRRSSIDYAAVSCCFCYMLPYVTSCFFEAMRCFRWPPAYFIRYAFLPTPACQMRPTTRSIYGSESAARRPRLSICAVACRR